MFAVLDTETSAWKFTTDKIGYKFACIRFYENDKQIDEYVANSSHESIEYMLKIARLHGPYRIYVHNLDFDSKFIMKELFQRFSLRIIKNHTLMSITVQEKTLTAKGVQKTYYDRKGNKHSSYSTLFEIRDSCVMFYHLSVKKLGKIIGLPKMVVNYGEMEKSAQCIEYCFRDCEIVARSLMYLRDFFKKLGLDYAIEKFPLTLPALSFKLFLEKNREFQYTDEESRKKNRIFDIHPATNQYFRKYYGGGRVEVFDYRFEDEVAVLDNNSGYPHEMTSNLYPLPKYTKLQQCHESKIDIMNNPLCFAVECYIDESTQSIPAHYEKFMVGGIQSIVYMAKKKKVLLTIEEYRYFIDSIESIVCYWVCEKWVDMFAYMKEIFKMKAQFFKENNPMSELCKLPMNATYGKLAEKLEKNTDTIHPIEILDNLPLYNELCAGGIPEIQEQYQMVIFHHSTQSLAQKQNVIIPWRITNLFRFHMWLKIMEFVEKGIRVKYTDTDSIVIPIADLKRVQHELSTEMGKFKLEKILYNYQPVGPKEYLYQIPADSVFGIFEPTGTAKGFAGKDLLQYSVGSIQICRPIKMSEAIRRKKNIEDSIVITKHKSTFYFKRKVNSDGSTDPLMGENQLSDMNRYNTESIWSLLTGYYEKFEYMYPNIQFTQPDAIKQKRILLKDKHQTKAITEREISKAFDMDGIELPDNWMDSWDSRLTTEENYSVIKAQFMSKNN